VYAVMMQRVRILMSALNWAGRLRLTASSGAAHAAATRVGALSAAGGAPRQHQSTQRVPEHSQ